jgi:hypothetical protein
MAAQTVDWVSERNKAGQKHARVDTAALKPLSDIELQQGKLGPASGIVLGLLMGAFLWAVIISAVIHLV